MAAPLSALVDAESWALLALSDSPYVCSQLARSSPSLQSEDVHGVNWPNYRNGFAIAKEPIFPVWRWNPQTRLFEPTPPLMVSDELKARSILAIRKARALWEIVYEISTGRVALWRGPILQETVYLGKRLQALEYKCTRYQADVRHYPYVLQYAEFSGLEPQAAADEILFKAQLDDEMLSKTEYLRLKYFKLIAKVSKTEEIEPLLKEFRWEIYKYWKIL